MYGNVGFSSNYPFGKGRTVTDPSEVDGLDFAVFWGGEDISTSFYNEPAVYTTAVNRSYRDNMEAAIAEACISKGIPMVGICRGAQLLNCLAGGKLFQDVEGHTFGNHLVTTLKETFKTNTCHHQALRLPKDGELIAWSELGGKRKTFSGISFSPEPEVEIAFLPNIKTLAVQYHPEWLPATSRAVTIVHELIKEKLGVNHAA